MPTFTVNDHDLYYEIHGDENKPPLALLHQGLGASAEWGPQIAYFTPDYRVITHDRWGYGRSDPRPGFEYGYLFDDTQETIDLWDYLGVRDACVLGHSDGGTLALLLAASRPDLVRAMVVEAAHIYYEPSIHTGISRMIATARHNPKVTAYLAALHGEEKARTLVEHWLPHWLNAENVPAPLVAGGVLRSVRCPVLVVQGQHDEYATDRHAIDIDAALPNSELWLIPDCGHTPHAALGDAFNRRAAEFFAGHLAAPDSRQGSV